MIVLNFRQVHPFSSRKIILLVIQYRLLLFTYGCQTLTTLYPRTKFKIMVICKNPKNAERLKKSYILRVLKLLSMMRIWDHQIPLKKNLLPILIQNPTSYLIKPSKTYKCS